MYHSIIFMNASGSTKNTWDNWQLIPTAKPTFPMPEPQLKFVEVPGMDGSYDISNYLTNEIKYSDRKATFQFKALETASDWDSRCSEIGSFLHGQKLKIFLEDDPDYYYEGRVKFSEKNSGDKIPTISFECQVGPYKINTSTGNRAL